MTTERAVLDALHRHLGAKGSVVGTLRYIIAEHPRTDATYGGSIADAVAVDTWRSGGYALHGYEVKVSRSDWLRELRAPEKSARWRAVCDRWWLLTIPGVAKPDELPEGWGLLEVRGHGVYTIRQAPLNREKINPGPATLAGLLRAASQTADVRATRRSEHRYAPIVAEWDRNWINPLTPAPTIHGVPLPRVDIGQQAATRLAWLIAVTRHLAGAHP